MSRLLYSDVKNQIAAATDLCGDDSRLRDYINRGQEELLYAAADFMGKHVRMRLCVRNGNITYPPEIETIEHVTRIDNCRYTKMKIKDFWFEFLENTVPPQEQGRQSISRLSLDRADAPTFDDIRGENKKLKIYCDVPEASGATVRITGTGSNGTNIRTIYDSAWQDGETLTLNNVTPQETINVFASIESIYFSGTRNGYVRLYEVDTISGDERLLAIYQPWQTRPEFRRSFITGLCDDDDAIKTILIIGKRRFVPALTDDDPMIIQSLNALIEITMAIKERQLNMPSSKGHRDAAIDLLDQQFQHWQGMTATGRPVWQNGRSWGFAGARSSLG